MSRTAAAAVRWGIGLTRSLEPDQVRGLDAAGDAAEVDHQRRLGDDVARSRARVRGDDRGHVGARRAPSASSTELEPELGELGDVGVVVGDLAAELAQQADDLQRRRLADVADPGLVGDAEDQDLASP